MAATLLRAITSLILLYMQATRRTQAAAKPHTTNAQIFRTFLEVSPATAKPFWQSLTSTPMGLHSSHLMSRSPVRHQIESARAGFRQKLSRRSDELYADGE